MRPFTAPEKKIIQSRLLDAAYRLFSQQGYVRTNVEQIARTAGIGKGTFYLFFKSKEDLLWALHDKLHGDYEAQMLTPLEDLAKDPERAIKSFLRTVFQLFNDPLLVRLQQLGELSLVERTLTPEQIREHRDLSVNPLVPLIREAQQAGVLIPGDPEVIAGAIRGICLLGFHEDDIGADVYPQVLELLMTLVARGLTQPGNWQASSAPEASPDWRSRKND